MLLRLIKTRPMNTGCHCEVWIINHLTGDTKLGNVFVLYEHLPLEIIYHVTVRLSGLYIHGQHCGWVWENPLLEALVNSYLMEIQASREQIYLDICEIFSAFFFANVCSRSFGCLYWSSRSATNRKGLYHSAKQTGDLCLRSPHASKALWGPRKNI